MSKSFRTKYLFQKYLNNASSLVEMEELFELLKSEDNLKAIEHDMESLWGATEKNGGGQEREIYQRFKNKITAEKKIYLYSKARKVNYKWTAAAAIILVILLVGGYFYQFKRDTNVNYTAGLKSVKVNPNIKRIVLSDGSIVFLNKGSYLNYPSKFANKNREVYLTGEAYFDIKHDTSRPFLVHAGKLTTRVLGTAFNIKTQLSGNLIEVTVTRGKVAVSNPIKTLTVILPNQSVSYDGRSDHFSKNKVNAHLSTLWKEEDLILDNITLKQAAEKIEAHYNTKIILDNAKIESCRFTAYFLNTTDLNQVLEVISRLNNLKYTMDSNGVYTLSGYGCY